MKKVLFTPMLCLIVNITFAYTNYPPFPDEINKYLMSSEENRNKSAMEFLETLEGDTLHLTCTKPPCVAFVRLVPDTIWIKQRKQHAIEGRHYYLDTIYGSKEDITSCYPKTNIRKRIVGNVIETIVLLHKFDSTSYVFQNVFTKKKGIWYLNRGANVSISPSLQIKNKMEKLLSSHNFYVKSGSGTDEIKGEEIKFGYNIYALEFQKSLFSIYIKDKEVTNHTSLEYVTKNLSNPELTLLPTKLNDIISEYNLETGYRTFISKNEADSILKVQFIAKATHQYNLAREIRQKDSTFVCEGYVTGYHINPMWNSDKVHVNVFSCKIIKENAGYLSYDTENYGVVYKGKVYWLRDYYLSSTDNTALAYLKKRGDQGMEERKQSAILADKKYWQQVNHKAKLIREQEERKKKEITDMLNKNEYFLIEYPSTIEKANSDYEGISFKFYNCYDKTVNYIYYKAVAYNSVGDKQYDLSGENTKYLEIIGPIRPGEVNWEYNNEIFYDSKEKISKIRIEEMRIVFSDGSTKHFKSYSEIISHYEPANL